MRVGRLQAGDAVGKIVAPHDHLLASGQQAYFITHVVKQYIPEQWSGTVEQRASVIASLNEHASKSHIRLMSALNEHSLISQLLGNKVAQAGGATHAPRAPLATLASIQHALLLDSMWLRCLRPRLKRVQNCDTRGSQCLTSHMGAGAPVTAEVTQDAHAAAAKALAQASAHDNGIALGKISVSESVTVGDTLLDTMPQPTAPAAVAVQESQQGPAKAMPPFDEYEKRSCLTM